MSIPKELVKAHDDPNSQRKLTLILRSKSSTTTAVRRGALVNILAK